MNDPRFDSDEDDEDFDFEVYMYIMTGYGCNQLFYRDRNARSFRGLFKEDGSPAYVVE